MRQRIRIPGRRLLARAAIASAMVCAAGGVAVARPATAAATTYTISLTASPTSLAVGAYSFLDATVTPAPAGGYMSIWDENDNSRVTVCSSGNSCPWSITKFAAGTHTFIAYLASGDSTDPPAGLMATSNTVSVTWSGSWTWSVSLSASETHPVAGNPITLTAISNGSMTQAGYVDSVIDQTTNRTLFSCNYGTACSGPETEAAGGTHTYVAQITGGGTVQATSAPLVVDWQPPYSDQCGEPVLTVVDGQVAGTYARVRVQQRGGTTLVCYRLDSGGNLNGGQLAVTPGGVGVGLPSTDADDTACAGTSGNTAPGPHPLVSETTAAGTFAIDTYLASNRSVAWICVTAGPLHQRVVVPVSASGVPAIAVNNDPIEQPAPAPVAGPVGSPSSSCVAGGGSGAVQYLDATTGTTHEWLSAWQRNADEVDVCARLQDASGTVVAGGLLTFTVPSAGGGGIAVTPVFGLGTDTSACTQTLAEVGQPPSLQLAVTPAGGNPAVVCARVPGAAFTVTVGATVSSLPVQLVLPTFTPDPDSAGV